MQVRTLKVGLFLVPDLEVVSRPDSGDVRKGGRLLTSTPSLAHSITLTLSDTQRPNETSYESTDINGRREDMERERKENGRGNISFNSPSS